MKLASHINLNLLAIFETIYSQGGVSPAARHLNLSQPAISHSLAKLRAAFGDRLFVRSGNTLVPTPLARAMIQPVREALRSVETAFATATNFDPATATRSFAIGLRPTGEGRSFPELAKRALDQAPGISLTSATFRRRDLPQTLARGRLDVVLDVDLPESEGVTRERLHADPLVVVARADHPAIGQALDLDTYLALGHVFVSPRPSGLGREDAVLAELGRSRRIAVRCQHMWSAWQIVSASDMICTLPESSARALLAVPGNRLFRLPFKASPTELFMYWHEALDLDRGHMWLRELIREHFARLHHSDASAAVHPAVE